jgi:hypothetical protein
MWDHYQPKLAPVRRRRTGRDRDHTNDCRAVLRKWRRKGRTGPLPISVVRLNGQPVTRTRCAGDMNKPLTAAQRVLRAKAAADASWANTSDRAARTEPARRAALARFERQVDPNNELPEDERHRRAASARRSYFRRLALRSAQTRGYVQGGQG